LIRRRPNFSFASLQGQTADRLLPEHLRKELSTVVFYKEGEFYTLSKAISEILKELGGVYLWIGILLQCMPDFFSDGVYRMIAQRRYKLFGKRDSCRLPDENEKQYFLP
jgi:predicted DCC family thiol-disulfide oxidoreductase YuxK